MNRLLTAVLMCTVAVSTGIQAVQAQEEAGASPVEAFYCNIREGKGRKDIEKAVDKFNAWSDANAADDGYTAWMLAPQFATQLETPDLIWLGSWENGVEMGNGIGKYLAEGGDVQASFEAALECNGHALASSVEINAPAGPPENGVVMFTQCSMAEGKTWQDAMGAHKANAAAMTEMGGKGSSWMFFPMLGGSSEGFDYWSVTAFQSWPDFGAAYEMYVNGGGWQKAMGIMQGNVTCGDPTVWDAYLVRQGNRE